MSAFIWQDRNSAAYHLVQLVYHGPAPVRHSALEVLQAIRSLSVFSELKQIALDTAWLNKDRSDSVYALAAMPNDIYIPEFVSILSGYIESGFAPLQQALERATDEILRQHLLDERVLLSAIFRLIGMQPSNRSWFLTLLSQAHPRIKVEFLDWAISSNCGYPGEPYMLELLTKHLDQYPELMTLDTFNTVANHGNTLEDLWLVAHVEKFISLCMSANDDSISSVLNYSPELTAKVAETHLEIAKLSFLFPQLEEFEAKTADFSAGESSTRYVPAFYSSRIWQQLEQIYQRANSGDERAFDQLYESTDDSRLSVPVRAVATYFFGKLWTHGRVLNKLCRLAYDGDELWGKYGQDSPIRIEAVDALQATGTPQAWEALITVIFLERDSLSVYHDKYLRWLSALTSQLDPSIPFEPVKEDRYNSHIEFRPWFDALTEVTDDIDMILKDY